MELNDVLVGEDNVVPRARYTSPEFAALEFDRLWSRVWQVACRDEEITDVGDFCEYLIGDQSILVVRSAPETVRAFHNTCLHRGTRLADGAGRFPEGCIRCRYHAWRYDLDGKLVEVVDRAEFDAIPENTGLKTVRVDRWGGFVWVCLTADAPPLLDYLGPLPALLAPYHLERLHLRTYLSTVLPANWKVAVDAFNEGYHVQGTHPQLLPWTDDVSLEYETLGIHAHYGRLPNARRQLRPSPRLGLSEGEYDEGEILEAFIAGLGGLFYRDEGTLVEEIRASGADGATMLSRYQKGRRALLEARGVAIEEFADDQLTSADDVFFFPNMVGPIYPGIAIIFRVRPNGTDPDSCIKDTWFLQWPQQGEPPKRAKRRFFPDWTDRDWGEITNQDYANMEHVQIGMKSRGGPGLRLNGRQESNLLHMHRVIDRYLTSG
ncbi:MAG TPA: aromatic ring-hydroxylating dioxygenase subunit alpha [Acidimicrobiales bacterium]|jgi:phenylpropionate dioxygenase-like ring-hydroxylating dioxygenase large terminal subunit|nr:aromatic ring-hydroxylating dioxygenase subunit alpha [Acidimicrobiales bacterium]